MSAAIESEKEVEKVPAWIVAVMSGILGAAGTAAWMAPMNNTPDYKRGVEDGYQRGVNDATASENLNRDAIYNLGYVDGQRVKHIATPTPK